MSYTYDAPGTPRRGVDANGVNLVTGQFNISLTEGMIGSSEGAVNGATWGAATAACTLQTPGSNGPDRITKILYDPVSAVSKVQTAFGVTTVSGFPATLQRDEVTNSYTNNGRQASVADAKGNVTSYSYDVRHRAGRTRVAHIADDRGSIRQPHRRAATEIRAIRR